MSEYQEDNLAQRARLRRLATRLSDDDLRAPLANGLTVADQLVHMAFWDDYCCGRLRQWERSGYEPVALKYDTLNDTVLALARAIPGRSAIGLVLAAADAVDLQVEAVSPQLLTALDADGALTLLDRAGHRRRHLDQIDTALAPQS